MPRSAICKNTPVRRMSMELVDGIMSEILAAPEFQAKLMTFDASAMRLYYTVGDHAVRAMLQQQQQQQQQQ